VEDRKNVSMEADVPLHGMETWTTRGVQLHPYLPRKYLHGGEWSASHSGQFTHGERAPYTP
jgi:hypothetical protein